MNNKTRPFNYQYPLFLIQFFVAAKLTTSCSFRALQKLIVTMNLYLDLELGQPCYVTILIWTKKVGFFSMQPPIEKHDDWVLIIDESIAIGHERLLVIYGIRSSQISFNRSLTYNDLKPFFIKSSSTWTAEIIKKEIEILIEKWGDVKYFVADGGNGICKSIRLLGKVHVYDVTHKMAWLLKNMYSKDEVFIKYTKAMSLMRLKGVCSDISHLIPPKQRVDSRFMNLDIISDWGLKALNCLKTSTIGSKIHESLSWVLEFKELIIELDIINTTISEIKAILKIKGLSKKTVNMATKIFNRKTLNARLQYFKENLLGYLKQTLLQLPGEKQLLCTSDIIESSFGKYKNYMSQNSMAGITDLSLCLAAFTNRLDEEEMKAGLERTKMSDLKIWSKENIGETNFSKRKKTLVMN
jgi:hypothetical protein